MEEATRMGILNPGPDGYVEQFEEKPKQPKSNLASMGIYIFTWKELRRYLLEDDAREDSAHDFGKNIIPNMLNDGKKMVSYRFDGYWKDVGTVGSLWDANMDLLNPSRPFDIWDRKDRIYTRTAAYPPHYIDTGANVQNCIVSEGCRIYGRTEFSVLFGGVTVEPGADVEYSILMPGAVVKSGASVRYAIVAQNSVIEEGAKVGGRPEEAEDLDKWGIAVVGGNCTVGRNADVKANAMVYESVKEGEVKC